MTFRALRHAVIRALGGTTDMAPAVVDYRKRPPVAPQRVSGVGMSEQDIAEATAADAPQVAYAMPKSPPWLPSSAGGIAMDSAGMPPALTAASLYAWAGNGAFSEGLGFLGYPYLAELTQRPEYRRVSEIWAAESVRKWIEFTGDPDRVKLIEKAMERFKVQDVIRHAIELDGFFGRAQIFPDLGYEDNDAELRATFVPKAKVSAGSLKGFNVIEPFWSYPGSYQSTNPLAKDFYKPREWYVMGKIVDSSWLITIVGRPMPDLLKPAYAFGGLAQSQMVKPYVDNWLRTRQSVSDLIHSFSTMVLKTNMATIIQGALGGAKKLIDRIRLFNRGRDNRGLMAIDKETEELENISTPLGTLDKLQAQSQEQIASVAGIPLVVLLGVTPSGLNASSDGEIRTFYATIMGYLSRVIKHPLQYMIDLIQLDIDGTIDPDIKWRFIDLWETPEAEKANIRKADAETDIAYCGAGVISNENVRERITKDPESIYYGMTLEEGEKAADPADEPPLDDEPDDGEPPEDKDQKGKLPGGASLPKLPAQDAAFEEDKHPRGEGGKFGAGGGGGTAPSPAPEKAVAKFAGAPTVWTSKASGIEYVANPIPQVPREETAKVRGQQEALEDAFADGSDEFFTMGDVDPADLKSLQNQVARDQVVNVATAGSFNSEDNGEYPLVINGPDGLILIDGNHRASAALVAGGKLKAQVFDYDKWTAAQEAKKPKPTAANREDDDALLAELRA